MINKKDIWFKAKTYGWGWCPCTWQGWVVILSFIIGITINSMFVIKNKILFGANMCVLVMILIIICLKKGEKPRWRWGK